jgi:hypothetical protein
MTGRSTVDGRSLTDDQVKLLRQDFDPEYVGKKPQYSCRDCSKAPGKCCANHSKSRCAECGQWITSAHFHIDFVGHAHVTDRLLEVDPEWTWEPFARDEEGCPLIRQRDAQSVLWIYLTVGGVTKPGVGIAASSKDELEKELVSDALKNAAMRFGVALSLWAKGDLHAPVEDEPAPPIDWPALGWSDQVAHDTERERLAARSKGLPGDKQQAMRAWFADQGWTLPYERAQMEAWADRLDVMADVVEGGADEHPPSDTPPDPSLLGDPEAGPM